MKELKINFTDFWPNYDKKDNYFYNLLETNYDLVIDENPDLLFYSSFGHDYLNYKCTRIFYTGENKRPDFTACDFAFTFDFLEHKKHFRLPLYSIYIDHHHMLSQLEYKKTREEAALIWKGKTKFCCMVVSNPNCTKRIEFFKYLSTYKPVDSGGNVLNNVGGQVANKAAFIKEYKFVISFENSLQDGYTTEKIMEPILQDCIPIYWGNKLVDRDFNSQRFLDYNQFKSEEDLIKRILEIDQNDDLAIDMIMQSTFSTVKMTHNEEHNQILEILSGIIENNKKPIAVRWYRYLHHFNLFCTTIMKSVFARLIF
jgi:alpha(1,3/1,4) fucosyltransferase